MMKREAASGTGTLATKSLEVECKPMGLVVLTAKATPPDAADIKQKPSAIQMREF